MQYIASCSFGKDSIASILLALMHNEPLDFAVFSEVMFDAKNGISGEIPEHIEWVKNVAIPKLEMLGCPVKVLTHSDYLEQFYHVNAKGNKYNPVIGDNEDFSESLINTFFENFDYCKEMFLFGADYYAELLPDKNMGSWLCWDKRKESQADAIGSEFELVWSRNKHKRRMLRHDWFGFLSSENTEDARNRVHPTQKPVTLIVDILKQWGQECQSVVDLFGGSGTTMIACEQLGRKCYMMELDPHYCDIILARWEKLTGKEAVRIQGS